MDKWDVLRLERQIGFPFYICAKEMARKYKYFLDEIGLTYTQYITLLVLWEQQPLTVKELGSHLYLNSGTMTPLLKKLEKAGLIRRERDKHDERNMLISVTDKGMALREQAASVPGKMDDCIRLSVDEIETLHTLLIKIVNLLQE